ncbi:MAG: hypothetical protein IJT30_04120 [Muribaculaceae bacterium]|nr:hypothetical protein [Muribaculaceae bacterium]
MKHQFDFNQIGRRMPYTVPEGFFAAMEQQVLARVKAKKKGITLRVALKAMVGIAAAIVLALVIDKYVVNRPTPRDMGVDVDQSFMEMELAAFSNLDADDQDFLIEVYDEDLYFNNEFDENNYIYN